MLEWKASKMQAEIDRLRKVNAKLVEALESLLEMPSYCHTDELIMENGDRRTDARAVLKEARKET